MSSSCVWPSIIWVPLFLNKTQRKIVDIQKVNATVGIDVYKAFIRMHTYTGCDTVSAFAGKGSKGTEIVQQRTPEHFVEAEPGMGSF